jgi:hypothetical protein
MDLHSVIIRKPISIEKAREIASEYMDTKKKSFYRETNKSFRFRNIPKQKFKSFRSKKINPETTLIYGEPKIKAAGFAERGNVGGNLDIMGSGFMDKLQDFILRYNPITLIGKALINAGKSDLQSKNYFQPKRPY